MGQSEGVAMAATVVAALVQGSELRLSKAASFSLRELDKREGKEE